MRENCRINHFNEGTDVIYKWRKKDTGATYWKATQRRKIQKFLRHSLFTSIKDRVRSIYCNPFSLMQGSVFTGFFFFLVVVVIGQNIQILIAVMTRRSRSSGTKVA